MLMLYYVILFLAKLPPLTHKVVETVRKGNTVTPERILSPTAVTVKTHKHNSLDFALGKANNEHDICVYSMQVYPNQQDLTTEPVSDKISESSDLIPPRILQSVHGYFNLRCDHPTRLNLSASWDEKTVSFLHKYEILEILRQISNRVAMLIFSTKCIASFVSCVVQTYVLDVIVQIRVGRLPSISIHREELKLRGEAEHF